MRFSFWWELPFKAELNGTPATWLVILDYYSSVSELQNGYFLTTLQYSHQTKQCAIFHTQLFNSTEQFSPGNFQGVPQPFYSMTQPKLDDDHKSDEIQDSSCSNPSQYRRQNIARLVLDQYATGECKTPQQFKTKHTPFSKDLLQVVRMMHTTRL